jgi:two-component system, cell cycle response regulator DivK
MPSGMIVAFQSPGIRMLARREDAPAQRGENRMETLRAPRTLLVVDDEPLNRDLVNMVVDEAGLPVSVVEASTGEEAVALATTVRPNLILMDLKLPGLDGWEATRRLKAGATTADIPIIAVSAQAMAGDRERALAAGCDGYLSKPVDIQQLTALLQWWFR